MKTDTWVAISALSFMLGMFLAIGISGLSGNTHIISAPITELEPDKNYLLGTEPLIDGQSVYLLLCNSKESSIKDCDGKEIQYYKLPFDRIYNAHSLHKGDIIKYIYGRVFPELG